MRWTQRQTRCALLGARIGAVLAAGALAAAGLGALLGAQLTGALAPSLSVGDASSGAGLSAPPLSGTLAERRNLFNQALSEPEPAVEAEAAPAPAVATEPVVETEPEPAAVEVGGVPRSDLPVRLLATMVAVEPRLSVAHLQVSAPAEDLYVRVGEALADATILSIERSRVLLRRGGRVEYLALGDAAGSGELARRAAEAVAPQIEVTISDRERDRAEANATGQAVIRPHAAREASAGPRVDPSLIERRPDGAVRVDARTAREHTRLVRELTEGAQLGVARVDGEAVGVRVGRVAPGTLLEQVGLQESDVIVGIDGAAPTEAREGLRFLDALGRGQAVEVEVDRRGRRQILRLTTD